MFKKNRIFYFLILFFLYNVVSAQVGYVPVNDEIYMFLERMQTLNIIEDYNSFEIPKTRSEIKTYLVQITKNINKLDKIDKKKLNDFVSEFEYDLFGSINNSVSFFNELNPAYIISDKEKYLFSYTDSNKANIFINALGMLNYLTKNSSGYKSNAFLYRFGGEIRGSLFNRLGFYAKTTNGSYSGSKQLAQSFGSLKYNYKINNPTGSEIGDNFFDETEAFLTLDYNYVKLKIGNDRKIIGHGAHKIFLSNNAPRMEYVEFDLNYKSLSFSYIQGKILGLLTKPNSPVFDKYFVYHRLQYNPSKHFNLGLGEMLIYANRNIDFSYLNPFNFYKSSEHLNQDRDNSYLFLDFQNNSIKAFKFYSTFLIDDIDFGKIGTGWYGNKTVMNFGVYSSIFYNYLPLDFELQYLKIEPYVFAHRLEKNNFTSLTYNLGTSFQPNTSAGIIKIYYRPFYRVNMSLAFTYAVHGANKYDKDGKLIANYGGNILQGFRIGDSQKVFLLDGEKEIIREISLTTTYEPKRDIILSLNANFLNNKLAASQKREELFFNLALYLKF